MLIMKLRRLAAMLIAAAMMVTFMPAMAFADDLPVMDCEWKAIGSGSPGETQVFWDSVKALGDRAQDVDHFSGKITYHPTSGDPVFHEFTNVGFGNTSYEAKDFIISHGTGQYAFEVEAYDSNNEKMAYGSIVTSFNRVTIKKTSLDSDGTVLQGETDNTLSFGMKDRSTQQRNDGDVLYYPTGGTAEVIANADSKEGFTLQQLTINGTSYSEREKEFSFVEDSVVEAVFKKTANKKTVKVDAGHEMLADYVLEKIRSPKSYDPRHSGEDKTSDEINDSNAEKEGTIVSFSVLESWSNSDVQDELKDVIEELCRQSRWQVYVQGERLNNFYVGLKPIEEYKSEDEVMEDNANQQWKLVQEGQCFYYFWEKPVRQGDLAVKSPKCGTVVTTTITEQYGALQENAPEIEASGQIEIFEYHQNDAYWLKDDPADNIDAIDNPFLNDTIKGGNFYYMMTYVKPKWGYYFEQNKIVVTINSKEPYSVSPKGEVYGKIKAEHDWSDWNVTKQPTTSEEGEETRTCKICGARETRAIPKLPVVPVKQKKPLMATVRTKGKKSVRLSWNVMEDADGYDIFFARCNTKKKKYTCKYAGSVRGAKSTSWTKSSLKKGIPYKMYVKAYVIKDGKKSYFAKSPTVHAFASGSSKKYTNPKSVRVKKASAAIKAGKTYKIKASVVKLKKNKTLINTGHAPKLRYLSTDTSVATVSKSGKVKGKAAGSCKIYVYAVNGMKKAVKITVS